MGRSNLPSVSHGRLLPALLLVLNPIHALCLAAPPSKPEPRVQEHVDVTLVEVTIHVTDKKGHPVTDLKPEEIRVFEGDIEQHVAYLEAVSKGGSEASRSAGAPPAKVYDNAGNEVLPSTDTIVLPPLPRRRIVIAFDPANSRLRVRKEWKTAALDWLKFAMQPTDLVGVVVFHSTPEWLQQPTSDRRVIVSALEGLDLESRGANRDRRQEMTKFVDELQACVDVTTQGGRQPNPGGVGSPNGSVGVDCALRVAEPYVHDWGIQAAESIANVRTLTGQLSAVDGRKQVLLFSEGIVPDAAGVAVSTFTSLFPPDQVPQTSLLSRLKNDVVLDIDALHSEARAAGVVFFTFDTRSNAERGYFETSEYARPITATTLGVNPWAEMYDATSSTLAVLAAETGGRPSYGTKDLFENLYYAADSYFGTYNLGYYRPEEQDRKRKLHLKVLRKGLVVDHPTHTDRSDAPRPMRLEITVRKPEPSGRESKQWLPILLQVPFAGLPLRREGGVLGCQLGYFIQAARIDGTVVDEQFQDATVAIQDSGGERSRQTDVRQLMRLELPPGAYRIRARVSDDRQKVVAERSLDLTIDLDGVRGGLSGADPANGAATGAPPPSNP
jgi:VWFA-related protein